MKFISHLIADPAPICLTSLAVHVIAALVLLCSSITDGAVLDSYASAGPQSERGVSLEGARLPIMTLKLTLRANMGLAFLANEILALLGTLFLHLFHIKWCLTFCVWAIKEVIVSSHFECCQISLHFFEHFTRENKLEFLITELRLTLVVQAFKLGYLTVFD